MRRGGTRLGVLGYGLRTVEPMAYKISEVCDMARVGRTTVNEAIQRGELVARKRGKSVIILADDFRKWIEGLPQK